MTEKLETSKANVMLLAPELKDWKAIQWQQVNRRVHQLRQRIYRASVAGDLRQVRNLQRLMMRSTANKLLAIRQVTQCNKGKRTPGIDGLRVLHNEERISLFKSLKRYYPDQVRPVKRVYIPKANGKQRPLGIPTIRDRCQQTIVKAALEPYWEARFEATSYGFRPGRSTHDAISRVFNVVKGVGQREWILDADIEGAFDHISHEHLMTSIGQFPGRGWIKSWLRSGVMESGRLTPTLSGTPQGGAISPLLLNIALHGIEELLEVIYTKRGGKIQPSCPNVVVRYADDLVVMARSEQLCLEAKTKLNTWLEKRGLRLSEEKTKISHIERGIDFLGVHIRRYIRQGKKQGKMLLVTPSKAAMQHFRSELRAVWKQIVSIPLDEGIRKLNEKVLGWGQYYRPYASKRVFNKLDNWMWKRQERYRYNRHPTKSWAWCLKRYWGSIASRKAKWVFMNPQTGQYLYQLSWLPIQRHKQVTNRHSPDDPTLKGYWRKRQQERGYNQVGYRERLWKRQAGLCSICQGNLDNGEALQVHHIRPRSEGGGNNLSNLSLLHSACHRQVHSRYGKLLKPLTAARAV